MMAASCYQSPVRGNETQSTHLISIDSFCFTSFAPLCSVRNGVLAGTTAPPICRRG